MWLELSNLGTLILTTALGFFIWILWQKRPSNSPPGTNGLPLLGSLLSLGRHPEKVMAKWAKQYGPVYMIKMGTTNVLVLGSAEAAYEAFAKYDFNDRPQSIAMFIGGTGLIFINKSDFQKEQRRFGLNTLRFFGMGRRTLEPRLIELCSATCDKIDDLCGKNGKSKPIAINELMFDHISSVISYMLLNHDALADDPKFYDLIHSLSEKGASFFLASILMFAPFLKHVFPFSYIWNKGLHFKREFSKLALKEIKQHQATFDENNLRDYVDCFLNEMTKETRDKSLKTKEKALYETGNEEKFEFSSEWKDGSSFNEQQLVAIIQDIFVAGTETTSTTMTWIFLLLCTYQDKQRKMQAEIDEVLGQSGIPRMATMDKLPYVKAVVQEAMRLKPVVPLNLPHFTTKKTTFRGHTIPKETIIVTNIWGIQNDEAHWSEPEKFLPERHLDENGKFQKHDNWLPFSVGSRNCVGQQLAKMELLLSTVMLFRRFSFSFEIGKNPDLEGENVVVLRPTFAEICAQRR